MLMRKCFEKYIFPVPIMVRNFENAASRANGNVSDVTKLCLLLCTLLMMSDFVTALECLFVKP